MLKNYKRILVVAAHPDDEVLGCGGTLIKLSSKKSIIQTVFLSDGESSRKDNILLKKKIFIRKKSAMQAAKIIKSEKPIFFDYPDNQLDKYPLLHYIKLIEKIIKDFKPDLIFTHSHSDLNIDHKIANSSVVTATRPFRSLVKVLLFFETLSNTEWNFKNDKNFFQPNFFINIEDTFKRKLIALKKYKSELRKKPHPRSIDSVTASAKKNGSIIGCKYAEAFQIGRIID